MAEDDIKVHGCWFSGGNKLYLESMKGYYDTSRWGRGKHFEDRRFTIRINDSKRFAFSHDIQLALMESVLNNDALPKRFTDNAEKFLRKIHEIKGKRKKFERENYNVLLVNFLDKKLWNCGGDKENGL